MCNEILTSKQAVYGAAIKTPHRALLAPPRKQILILKKLFP